MNSAEEYRAAVCRQILEPWLNEQTGWLLETMRERGVPTAHTTRFDTEVRHALRFLWQDEVMEISRINPCIGHILLTLEQSIDWDVVSAAFRLKHGHLINTQQ